MSEILFHTVFVFWFGAIWGSFANVIILRLPQNKSVVLPRSYCPSCKKTIPWYLNIPIFSWLLLRGRCHFCQVKISIRYPIVELLMAVFFTALFVRYGYSFSTLEYWLFVFCVLTASFIDLDHMILPDRFTLSGIVIGLLGAWFNPDRSFVDAFLGVLLGGGFLLAIAYFYYVFRKVEGMGGGDIKLLAWIGAVCGVQSILFVMIASSLLGLLVGVFYVLRSSDGLKTGIPFGPYLSLAAIIYLLFDVSQWLNFIFPIP